VFHARAARGDAVAAWVVRSGDGAARRVPELGIRFIVKEPPLATGRTQVRVETLLAVLATEARALPIDECFERVYGFAYQPVVHRGTFNVLVHRARERLGEGGSLERDGDHLHLWSDRLLVLPDPRCEPSLDERLLRYLAARGLSSTRDAASDLGVAVRTAQASLKRLTDDGACEMRRDGRHITYRLEDTTFLEPTTRF
jgi:DNA-binding transcriptional ArsR family regulator